LVKNQNTTPHHNSSHLTRISSNTSYAQDRARAELDRVNSKEELKPWARPCPSADQENPATAKNRKQICKVARRNEARGRQLSRKLQDLSRRTCHHALLRARNENENLGRPIENWGTPWEGIGVSGLDTQRIQAGNENLGHSDREEKILSSKHRTQESGWCGKCTTGRRYAVSGKTGRRTK
jgi:hypothetical protein